MVLSCVCKSQNALLADTAHNKTNTKFMFCCLSLFHFCESKGFYHTNSLFLFQFFNDRSIIHSVQKMKKIQKLRSASLSAKHALVRRKIYSGTIECIIQCALNTTATICETRKTKWSLSFRKCSLNIRHLYVGLLLFCNWTPPLKHYIDA